MQGSIMLHQKDILQTNRLLKEIFLKLQNGYLILIEVYRSYINPIYTHKELPIPVKLTDTFKKPKKLLKLQKSSQNKQVEDNKITTMHMTRMGHSSNAQISCQLCWEYFKPSTISNNSKKPMMLHAGKKERKKVIKAKSLEKETIMQKQTKETKSQQTSLPEEVH